MRKTAALLLVVLVLALLSGCGASRKEPYYSIDHFYIKEEGEAFRSRFNELVIDTYDWYRSIEGREGVYLIHYRHYSEETLEEWKNVGYMENIPAGALDYYVASPNYLEDRGITISTEDKRMIQEGVRYYLLPDTLGEEETQMMKKYLTEDALHGLDGETLIETAFRQERKIEFRTYHFDGTLEVPGGGDIKDPVIFVAGCSNMKYFEAESLIATGVSDAYIRLSEEAYKRYVKTGLPRELKEKKVTFTA